MEKANETQMQILYNIYKIHLYYIYNIYYIVAKKIQIVVRIFHVPKARHQKYYCSFVCLQVEFISKVVLPRM